MESPTEKFESLFNLPAEETPEEKQLAIPDDSHKTLEEKITDDYTVIRNNLYNLLNQGNTLLEYLTRVARGTDHPRAFEVAGQLMKNLVDINSEIVKLHKEMKKIQANQNDATAAKTDQTINNFIVSTDEITRMIEQAGPGRLKDIN